MLNTFITNSVNVLLFLCCFQIFGGKNKLINKFFYENRISKKQNSDITTIGNTKEKTIVEDKKSNRYTYCCELEKKTLKNMNLKIKRNAENLSVYNIKSQELLSYDKTQQSLVGAIICNDKDRCLEILDSLDDEHFNFSNSYQMAKSFGSFDIVIPRPEVPVFEISGDEKKEKEDEKSEIGDENNKEEENIIENEKNVEEEENIEEKKNLVDLSNIQKNYPKAVCINQEIVDLPHVEKQLLEVAYPEHISTPTVFTIGEVLDEENWLLKNPDLDLIFYSIISVHPEVLAVLLEKNFWSLTYKNISLYVKACAKLDKDLKSCKKKNGKLVDKYQDGVKAVKKLIEDKAKEIKISAKDKKFIFQQSLKIAKFLIE